MTRQGAPCHRPGGVAKASAKVEPLTAEQRIAEAFADLKQATQLAFDAQGWEVVQGELTPYDKPDLQALAKLIELAFKANGVLTADGKKASNDPPVPVSLDELERILKAAKAKAKEPDGKA